MLGSERRLCPTPKSASAVVDGLQDVLGNHALNDNADARIFAPEFHGPCIYMNDEARRVWSRLNGATVVVRS